jgi:hypothetical protein
MRIETNRETIQSWMKAKQANEQELLRRLNRLFGEPAALNPIRVVVLHALKQMFVELRAKPMGSPAQKAMVAENNLAVWQTLPSRTPDFSARLEQMVERLSAGFGADANDLSELMRVIGSWLEGGGGHGGEADINKAFRTGVGHVSARAMGDKNGYARAQQQQIDDRVWSKQVRERENVRANDGLPAWVTASQVKPKFNRLSGMQMFRVTGNDLCKRIDLLFGLLKGATISGTTTDTVMVLEAFGAGLGLHAGYYLFPVATIAASLHHTLLEAALALTLTGAIDSYRVGFYSSLVPKGGLPPELDGVRTILANAEHDARNRHFVVWYDVDESRPAGCIQWTGWEVQASRRLVEAKGLLAHIAGVPLLPKKADVAKFIALMAPQLLASLPQEFQPGALRLR